jgi:hypothetical protein
MGQFSAFEVSQKLGLHEGMLAYSLHAPPGYTLPADAISLSGLAEFDQKIDWLHAFFVDETPLLAEISVLKKSLKTSGQLWLSWPKRSSGIVSGLSDSSVRKIGLDSGLVDVKVAAIDNTWSGLKFVYRLSARRT